MTLEGRIRSAEPALRPLKVSRKADRWVIEERLAWKQVADEQSLTLKAFLADSDKVSDVLLWTVATVGDVTKSAVALRALGACCRSVNVVVSAFPYVPGFRPSIELFPHQVAAVHRMKALEGSEEGVRGGILCDEPGLGKTITALALIALTHAPQDLHRRIPQAANNLNKLARSYSLACHLLHRGSTPVDRRRHHLMLPHLLEDQGRRSKRQKKEIQRTGSSEVVFGDGNVTLKAACQASLIVVPQELLCQWENQLRVQAPGIPFIKVDRADQGFPSADDLMLNETLIVLTTMERLGSRVGHHTGAGTLQTVSNMSSGLGSIHWARIIIDEGHELGGKGLGDLNTVLGCVLANAVWLMSGTAGAEGITGTSSQAQQDSIDGLLTSYWHKINIIRTPQHCINLPDVSCSVEYLPFSTNPAQRSLEHRLVARTCKRINDGWEALARVTDQDDFKLNEQELVSETTSKAQFVTDRLLKELRTGRIPSKTIIFSNSNQELHLAIQALQREAGYATDIWIDHWSTLKAHVQHAAWAIGFTPESWPNHSAAKSLPPAERFNRSCRRMKRRWSGKQHFCGESAAGDCELCSYVRLEWKYLDLTPERFWAHARTLGFSKERWPPVQYAVGPHRPEYVAVVSTDRGKEAKKARDQAVTRFMTSPNVSVCLMDSFGAVGFDLSLTQRIICLEPVHEPDAWRQLLSRARRMGAREQEIEALTLVYKGSREDEVMKEQCGHICVSIRRTDVGHDEDPESSDEETEDEGDGSIAWQHTGNEWLNKSVLHQHGMESKVGKITKWVPARLSYPARWRVVFPDGDEENLDQAEVKEALSLHAAQDRRKRPLQAISPPRVVSPLQATSRQVASPSATSNNLAPASCPRAPPSSARSAVIVGNNRGAVHADVTAYLVENGLDLWDLAELSVQELESFFVDEKNMPTKLKMQLKSAIRVYQ